MCSEVWFSAGARFGHRLARRRLFLIGVKR